MIGSVWLLAGCLLAGAVAVAWPGGARSPRRLASPRSSVWPPLDLAALRVKAQALASLAESGPRRLLALAAVSAALVGWVLGGPVAAMICGVYAVLAARAAIRRATRRRYAAARARSLDDLCALAADLRAGLPPAIAADPALAGLAVAGLAPSAAGVGSAPSAAGVGLAPSVAGVGLAPSVAGVGLAPSVAGFGSPLSLAGFGLRPGVDGAGGSTTVGAESGVAHAGGPGAGGGGGQPARAEQRIAALTAAVWRLAERTGAPAAELVERIEADARAADRGRASAQAQAAGAQATALLLAALPLGGIALGYGIGVDPLQVLLHTPLGAMCAVGAVLLQCVGLLWADRLASGPVA